MEKELFKKAMNGVTPISEKKHIEKISKIELPEGFKKKDDAETLKKLEDLVKYGKGLMFLIHRNTSKAQGIMSIRRLRGVFIREIIQYRHLLISTVSS